LKKFIHCGQLLITKLKLVPLSDFKAKMHHIRLPPHTPLGELTVLLETPQLYLRGLLLMGGKGKGRGGGRERTERGL